MFSDSMPKAWEKHRDRRRIMEADAAGRSCRDTDGPALWVAGLPGTAK